MEKPEAKLSQIVKGMQLEEAVDHLAELVEHHLDLQRGPQGERGLQGPQGVPGRDGMTRDEVARLIIEVLRDVGVQTELGNKLIKLRAQIHAWEKQADARHLHQVSQMVKQVDAMFGDASLFAMPTQEQIAVLKARLDKLEATPAPSAPVRMGWLKRILGW